MSRSSHLLVHYIRTLWHKAGLNWDSDNQSEVEEIIESLEPPSRFSPERENQRQRIASEQLAALIAGDLIVWTHDPDACSTRAQMVKDAVEYADLLLEELDKHR